MKTDATHKTAATYKRFIRRCLIVMLPVPIALVVLYVCIDPFCVIRSYPRYYGEEGVYELAPAINKGMISLRTYERNAAKMGYNAFIMGSSVSIPYRVASWCEHLPADAVPFHFDSSSESVHSLLLKLRYLERKGADMKYMLIVVPPRWFRFKDEQTPPYINRPEIDSTISPSAYHWMHLRAFYNREFFRSYVASKIAGRYLRVGTVAAFDWQPIDIDPATNEETLKLWDDSVRRFPEQFYQARSQWFANDRSPRIHPAYHTPEQAMELRQIADLLKRNATDFHVVIGPTLYKERMHPADEALLREVFGARFHDYSASMSYKADCDTNYFDAIHYRYPLAAEIMDSIYSGR